MTAYGIESSVSVTNQPIVRAGTSASLTFVSASVTDVQLLAPNSRRIGVIIYNDSNSPLYIGLGSSPVTSGSFTTVVGSHTERGWEIRFNGEFRGVWDQSTGGARVTELT